jgi:hypothetical protein
MAVAIGPARREHMKRSQAAMLRFPDVSAATAVDISPTGAATGIDVSPIRAPTVVGISAAGSAIRTSVSVIGPAFTGFEVNAQMEAATIRNVIRVMTLSLPACAKRFASPHPADRPHSGRQLYAHAATPRPALM